MIPSTSYIICMVCIDHHRLHQIQDGQHPEDPGVSPTDPVRDPAVMRAIDAAVSHSASFDESGPFLSTPSFLLPDPSEPSLVRRPFSIPPPPDTPIIPPSLIEIITPPANRLIDLVRTHYPAFEQTHPLHEHVRQAVRMATSCHTSALGGHVERCPNGHIERVFYNCCGHRFCPRCAPRIRRRWLLTRQEKLLPVRHYHVVFTLPHVFNALWHRNHRDLGTLLFHTATDALRAVLTDPRWLGAEPGLTVTLETWDDRLRFHPHLHCLVTGGGLSPTGEWVDVSNPRCLVAVTPLMWEFRKRFCQGLKQVLSDDTLTLPEGSTTRQWLNRLNKANRQNWEVFIAKPPEDGGPTTEDMLRYQAEDVAGGPLSGDRLLSEAVLSVTQLAYLRAAPFHETRLEETTEDTVRFRWGTYDSTTGRRERDQIETLPVADFLRRYLQHVPPSGFQTVRHYGLYCSAKKAAYAQCRELLQHRHPPRPDETNATATPIDSPDWLREHTCPICGQPLIVTAYLPSRRTGRVIPRPPLGRIPARPPTAGGAHVP